MASSRSNCEAESAKVEQIVSEFFSKCLHVILESRCVCSASSKHRDGKGYSDVNRKDKWFNLALRDCPLALQHTDAWRPRQMVVDLVLLQKEPELSSVKKGCDDGCSRSEAQVPSGGNCCKKPCCWGVKGETVIERWMMQYEDKKGHGCCLKGNSRSQTLYKRCILLLRSLYLTVKLLPAYKLFKDLTTSHKPCDFSLIHYVSSFVEPFTRDEEVEMQKYVFNPVETSCDSIRLSVLYLPSLTDLSIKPSYQMFPDLISDYFGSSMVNPDKRNSVLHNSEIISSVSKSSSYDRKPSLTESSSYVKLPRMLTTNVDQRETVTARAKATCFAKCHRLPTPPASSPKPPYSGNRLLHVPSDLELFPDGGIATSAKFTLPTNVGETVFAKATTAQSPKYQHFPTSPASIANQPFCGTQSLHIPAGPGIIPEGGLTINAKTTASSPMVTCLINDLRPEDEKGQITGDNADNLPVQLSQTAALGSLVNIFQNATPLQRKNSYQPAGIPNIANLPVTSTVFPFSPAVKTAKTALDAFRELQGHINTKNKLLQTNSIATEKTDKILSDLIPSTAKVI